MSKILYLEGISADNVDKVLDTLRKSGIGLTDKVEKDYCKFDLTVVITNPVTDEYIALLDEIYPNPANEHLKTLATLDVRERIQNLRVVADAYYQKKMH